MNNAVLNPYVIQLERAARLWPRHTAIWSDGRTFTYAQFARMADDLGLWLTACAQVPPGARVADLRFNSHRALVTEFGIVRAGAARVSLNPSATGPELRSLIELTEPCLLLADPELAERVGFDWLAAQGLPVVLDDDLDRILAGESPALDRVILQRPLLDVGEPIIGLRFTGGSTGEPKSVVRTARQQQWVAISMLADLYDLQPGQTYFHTQSLSVGAHSFVLPAVMRGATQVVTRDFDAEHVWHLCGELDVSVLKLVPTTLRRILTVVESTRVPDSLQTVLYGAAQAEPGLISAALHAFGESVSMGQTYGQCEAPAVIARLSTAEHERARRGEVELLRSIGRPYSAVDVVIVDQEGTPCPPGVTGEVTVRAPIVADWRWRNSRTEPLRPAGEVHRTGDLGHYDHDGILFLDGRMDDVVITGGYNVYPLEVERVLNEHPDVAQSCVVGVPDANWGERLCAAVVLKSQPPRGVTDELASYARARLSGYKVPKSWLVVEELPLTAANKVSRPRTREAFL